MQKKGSKIRQNKKSHSAYEHSVTAFWGVLIVTLMMTAVAAISTLHQDAAGTSATKRIESRFDKGQWSYMILDPICGVEGPLIVDVNIKKYRFVLYDDGSYEESFNIHSEIADSGGILVASSSTMSKYLTGSITYLPLESQINYVLKCSQNSAEPGQVTTEHTRLVVSEDGSVLVARGY